MVRASASARIAICGQAPGTRVHACGLPFFDPSGVRLRQWMAIGEAEFYDESRIAVVPMGFCFPGLDSAGSDLPPRRECAPLWRTRVMAALPDVELVLLIGRYAIDWHLPERRRQSMSAIVEDWRSILASGAGRPGAPKLLPLPHPSWRNNVWLRRNPWFERDLVPVLKGLVREALDRKPDTVGSRRKRVGVR